MKQLTKTQGRRDFDLRFWGIVWLIALNSLACGLLGGRRGPPAMTESMSPQWYQENAVIMIDYLNTMPPNRIGQKLPGILLSDGDRWLAGDTYLGIPEGLPEGVNVRMIEEDTNRTAYIWLEKDAAPLPLEPCKDGPQRGIRARRAGGGTYTWRTLRADHGLVYTICPPPNWRLPKPSPSTLDANKSTKTALGNSQSARPVR